MPIDHASNSSWEDESSDLPVGIGDVLDGKYKIIRLLGKGGMGVVLAAVHVELGHRIALKFLSRAGARNEETLARFALEAKAAAMMRSEHATRILDIGRLPDGEPYMVLEMLEGCDLGALVTRRGPLPVTDAVTYVLEACEAIAEAHSLGIVHRDLKPDNLFLSTRPDGTQIVKVLDFGISKFSWLTDGNFGRVPALTTTTAIIGSPMYMSPEQLRSTRDVDHRTDIWSIGVALYELISGQLPFPWRSMAELSAAILKDPPVPLSARLRSIPVELDQVIWRCLEKNPEDRFDNIAELAWALAPFAGPQAVHSAEKAAELLARVPIVPNKRAANRGAKRNPIKSEAAVWGSGRAMASPIAATRPAGGTSTTKPFQPMIDTFQSPVLRGLPAAAVFVFSLLALGSGLYVRSWHGFSTNVLEARRGLANAVATWPVTPHTAKANPTSVSGAEPAQSSTETPRAPMLNQGASKVPPTRINRETPLDVNRPGPMSAPQPNPFADRE